MMTTPAIRRLDDKTDDEPGAKVGPHGRVTEPEVPPPAIPEQTGLLTREEAIREMAALRRSLEGRYTGDPVAEIRAERDRRG